MNWLFSILFLFCFIGFNNITGKYVVRVFGFERRSVSQTIILGFLSTSFLQWVIGFFCQCLHLPWNVYFYALLCVYMLLVAGMIKYRQLVTFKRENLKEHIKKYWLLYVMAVFFTYWSISSQLPYLEMNYDDHYYIGAITQQVGSAALSTENYFSGAIESSTFVRLINTYEINYGFWATLFHIDIPFFVRFAMTYHNYFLFFMAIHALFATISKNNDRYLQFITLPFTILLIPGYYLQFIEKIKMYDDWQFNTAMWYGGSIIRTASLPICLMLANEWIKKPTIKKTLFCLLACAALISYSSVFLPFAISIFLIAMIMFIYKGVQTNKNFKWLIYLVLALVLLIGIIKVGPLLLEKISPEYTASLNKDLAQYIFYGNMYGAKLKIFLLYAAAVIIIFIKEKQPEVRRTLFGITLLSAILYCGLFDKFFILISSNVIFAGLRLMTGVQLLLLSCIGYCVYLVIRRLNIYHVSGILSIISLVLFSSFNVKKEELYKKLAYPGTGLSSYGFDYDRVLTNDKLIPTVHSDIGEYFKNNETPERHRVISPFTMPYERGTLHLTAGLIMSANNIEVCMTDNYIGTNGMTWGIANKLNSFIHGDVAYENVKDILTKFKIEYIVTPAPIVVNSLLNRGMELVVTSISSEDDVVYMLKTNLEQEAAK